jgi:hypothetical protein
MKSAVISGLIIGCFVFSFELALAKCVPLIKEAREQLTTARLSKKDLERVKLLLDEADKLSEANNHKEGIRKANEALAIINNR